MQAKFFVLSTGILENSLYNIIFTHDDGGLIDLGLNSQPAFFRSKSSMKTRNKFVKFGQS